MSVLCFAIHSYLPWLWPLVTSSFRSMHACATGICATCSSLIGWILTGDKTYINRGRYHASISSSQRILLYRSSSTDAIIAQQFSPTEGNDAVIRGHTHQIHLPSVWAHLCHLCWTAATSGNTHLLLLHRRQGLQDRHQPPECWHPPNTGLSESSGIQPIKQSRWKICWGS